jgi:hypothetical protein
MKPSLRWLRPLAAATLLHLLSVNQGLAWGPDGHSIVNRLAGEYLPADVPAFLRSSSALDALAYFSSEPDRWRSPAEPELNAAQSPEHYILFELADLAGPLPRRRYDFIRALSAAQTKHPGVDLTPERVGLQPYITTEVYERLQSAFRDYRALVATKKDTKPVECEITFLAGWLGHYVADGAQPMHTSIQYDGWVGANPHGYTTQKGVHWAFENDFVHANIKPADVTPLVAASHVQPLQDVFNDYMAYLRHSKTLVEQTYKLQKEGTFTGAGTPDGKTFVDERLAAGAIELRNIIYTAWVKSGQPLPAGHSH